MFRVDDTRVGYITRLKPRVWDLSDDKCSGGDDIGIYGDRRGGLALEWGLGNSILAWPRPPSQRSFYVLPNRKPAATIRRMSPSRWDFRVAGKLVGYSTGPDGAAAGLAFLANCF